MPDKCSAQTCPNHEPGIAGPLKRGRLLGGLIEDRPPGATVRPGGHATEFRTVHRFHRKPHGALEVEAETIVKDLDGDSPIEKLNRHPNLDLPKEPGKK